jgi:hypothetical protein
VAFPVSLDERAHDAQAVALAVQVLAVARLPAVGDDALDVPLVGIEEEAHQRLLIVRVAAGIGLDHQA